MTNANASIRYTADREFHSKYGPRINVVAETDDGVQAKVWADAGNWIAQLEKGQRVFVCKDKNGNWQITPPENGNGHAEKPTGQNGSTHQPAPAVGLTKMTKEEKLQLDAELQAYAKLHGRCWQLAVESLPQDVLVSEEVVQKVATMLFIQIVRRYAL